MKTFLNKTVFLSCVLFILPAVSFAQSNTSLVVPCNGAATTTDANGVPPCDFNTLILTATHLVQWLFYVSVPIMVALFAYAGILYMTGIGKNIDHAKNIFKYSAIGFTIMLIAFVAVSTVVGWIAPSNANINPSALLGQ
jgi:hypothetical protein